MVDFTDKLRSKLQVEAINIIKRKNPFLFRVRAGDDLRELCRMMIDSYMSSSEETMFGNILESVATAVCENAKGGAKSSAEGIDLEYDEGRKRTLIQVKSGPNWGNSSQRKRLVNNFNSAKKRLSTSGIQVRCVEGVCYGANKQKNYGTHTALIGKSFWLDISDWDSTHFAVGARLGLHAGNGMNAAKETARQNLAEFLETHRAAEGNKTNWQGMFDLLF